MNSQQRSIPARAGAIQRTTTASTPVARTDEWDDEYVYDDQWPPRMASSARRYQPALPAPRSAQPQAGARSTISLYLIVVFICICIGIILAVVVPRAWQHWRDGVDYGYPRTYQADANVGHGNPHAPSSHFLALNLGGTLEVIEIPGGDPAKYPPRLYRIASLSGTEADLVVLTVRFADINGDGKVDLIAGYDGNDVILFNTGKDFAPKP
jgi:hypothetical protein